ncbi:transposase, partial [Mesorhizobium sp. M7A.T.Ca.TU.009.01.1.2]
MARRISMATRSELVEAIVERYRSGSRSDKRLILDEFVAVTGYHRKHATECSVNASKIPGNKRHSLRYGGDVREALVVFV